jgi:hypothetical protein
LTAAMSSARFRSAGSNAGRESAMHVVTNWSARASSRTIAACSAMNAVVSADW